MEQNKKMFLCVVYLDYEMNWFWVCLRPQGVPIFSNSSEGITITGKRLVITKSSRFLSGSYTCAAANSEGVTTSDHIAVKIKCKSSAENIRSVVFEIFFLKRGIFSFVMSKVYLVEFGLGGSWKKLIYICVRFLLFFHQLPRCVALVTSLSTGRGRKRTSASRAGSTATQFPSPLGGPSTGRQSLPTYPKAPTRPTGFQAL